MFGGHCHAGRPSHDPSSMLLLKEGCCWPKSCDTWPHLSSPQYGACCLVPFAEKHPQSMFPPPSFTVGMVFLRFYSSFFFLQTRRVEFIPKSYILVSPDHMTVSHASSGSSRWSLATFRRAWTCADLSRGTLALQDFNPWWCSVLLMVTVDTVVLVLFRSLTRYSHVVLGWSLTFLRIIDTPWGEILHGAPVLREIDSHLEFLPFSNNCANSCCLFTKLFAYCPVAHSSLVQVYNFVPSVLRQLFGLDHSGEVGYWVIERMSFIQLTSSNRCN